MGPRESAGLDPLSGILYYSDTDRYQEVCTGAEKKGNGCE